MSFFLKFLFFIFLLPTTPGQGWPQPPPPPPLHPAPPPSSPQHPPQATPPSRHASPCHHRNHDHTDPFTSTSTTCSHHWPDTTKLPLAGLLYPQQLQPDPPPPKNI